VPDKPIRDAGQRWSLEVRGGDLSVQLSADLVAPDVEPLIAAVGEETRALPSIRQVVIHLPDEPIRKVVDALLEAMAENIRAGGVTVTFERPDTPRIVDPEDG
jgi:hypothetical protein